MVGNI